MQEIIKYSQSKNDPIIDITTQFGVKSFKRTLIDRFGYQAHFVQLPSHLSLPEHIHHSESIIYTVRGKWFLCSGGQRHLMVPGSLFWCTPNINVGYQVPFDQPAYVLIFRGDIIKRIEAFVDYLHNTVQPTLDQQPAGDLFRLPEIPEDHLLRLLARSSSNNSS